MYSIATKLNKEKIELSKSEVENKILEYEGKRGRIAYQLYDLGYISSSSGVDNRELLYFLKDTYKGVIQYLIDQLQGKRRYDADMFRYMECMYKAKADDDFKCLINLIKQYLGYTKDIQALNKLLSYEKFNKNKGKVKISLDLTIGLERIGSRNKYLDMNSQAILELTNKRQGKVYEQSLNAYNLDTLVKYVGGEVDNTNEPYFCAGLTKKEEVELYKLIINGSIKLDGRYGDLLYNHFKSFIGESETTKLNTGTLENKVMGQTGDTRRAYIEKLKTQIESNKNKEIIYIDNYRIVYIDKSKDNTNNNRIKGFGNYALDWVTCRQFKRINIMNGLHGEFIREEDVIRLGYKVNRAPMNIVLDSTGNTEKVYALDSVFDADTKPLEPRLGNGIRFEYVNPSTIFRNLGVSDKADAYIELTKLTPARKGNGYTEQQYKEYVAELVLAMIYMDCGETEYTFVYSYRYDFVDDKLYMQACFDAEEIFNKLHERGII